MIENSDSYRIRPAGRHLITIGEDLIHDHHAAVLELVKNAYDADSYNVTVTLKIGDDDDSINIMIEDDGHGMSRDTVINHWLVPSTKNKLQKRLSPAGRVMQGRKGIGRYAASILGSDLLLETVSPEKEKTKVYLQWSDFETAEYLSDVEILVRSSRTDESQGTKLIITGGKKYLSEWKISEINKLEYELKKLISPVENVISAKADVEYFKINLVVDGFFYESNQIVKKEIKPFPLFNLHDYRISGFISKDGIGTLKFNNQKARNSVDEDINVDLKESTGCGNLSFDIRVYDRESEAIDQIIKRGLKNDKGDYVGKNEAKKLLNSNNGIGVYRHGFRIRPLGDPDFDWLKLNEQRIQEPSVRIGSNQVIGYVEIESEELSCLEEKSARDGLKENEAFRRLKKITGEVISRIEERRYIYRSKAGLSRPVIKIEKELEKLFSFEDIRLGIKNKLFKSGINSKIADDIVEIISKKEEESNKIAEDIRRAVAIYQGQATLGKIINVILHEGRKPLNYFKSQIPNLKFWVQEFRVDNADEFCREILPITEGIAQNAQLFVNLFGRLDPLAAAKRKPKEYFDIRDIVKKTFDVFELEMIESQIKLDIAQPDKNVIIYGWPNDIYIILTNLIENSIYWLVEKKINMKRINVCIQSKDDNLEYLDYRDTGPGIEKHLIESEVIFEPEFTTKRPGTGLGLAIAGEAASRNSLQIKAFESDTGAYFRLQPTVGVHPWK
jgi:signal transduction histidine kinase